jgi:DNA polymerase (family 10)
MTSNKDIANHLRELSYRYRDSGDKHKSFAFGKAARTIEDCGKDVGKMSDAEILDLPSIGKSSLREIREVITSGSSIRAKVLSKDEPPITIQEFEILEGVGPKGSRRLWKEHGVATLGELRAAIDKGTIDDPVWKDRIEKLDLMSERLPRYKVEEYVEDVLKKMQEQALIVKAKAAGSLRRYRDTVGDLDFLIACEKENNAKIVKWLAKNFDVVKGGYEEKNGKPIYRNKVTAQIPVYGKFKQVDFNLCQPAEWGCYINYLTGSKEFNVALRKHALSMGYSINEHCVTVVASGKELYCEDERDVFDLLRIPFVPPECRIDGSEVGMDARSLLNEKEITGDFHTHTTWSDGALSVEQMVAAAMQSGLLWIGIADHDDSLPITRGIPAARIPAYVAEIAKVRKQTGFPVLAGLEVDVDTNGGMRIDPATLAQLDYVILSTHKEPTKDVTARLCAALKLLKSHTVILAHPCNRHLAQGYAAELDWTSILSIKPDVIVEINGQPDRLDLPAAEIRKLRGRVKFSVASDKHGSSFSIPLAQAVIEARKGLLTKYDLTQPQITPAKERRTK